MKSYFSTKNFFDDRISFPEIGLAPQKTEISEKIWMSFPGPANKGQGFKSSNLNLKVLWNLKCNQASFKTPSGISIFYDSNVFTTI